MKKTFLVMLMFASVLFFACKNESTNDEDNSSDNKTEVTEDNENADNEISAEDFATFYEKFVTDKNFQLERVKFPIEGSNIIDYGETEEWTKENWSMIENIDNVDTKNFTVEKNETETRVEHKFYVPNSGFSFTYVIELIDGKWYLTERTDSNL
ncbi:MAG: hypothetical protein JXL97_07570 [Bacteroidales bacterium]|nr:hypothetical protein [Bacteroidales bacterium]